MTANPSLEPKKRLLPSSPNELEQFVQETLGRFVHKEKEERAAIYSRLSVVNPKANSYSLEVQPDRSEEYARSKGWIIVGTYADPDRTGRNSRRPELQRMVRDIQSGRVSVVVVHRLDRLYRNLESLLRFLRFLKKHRVRLVSVTEQIDTDSWWGRLVLYVLGALAEMYVWQTSVRVREIKAEIVRRGLHNGLAPFGYCNGLCSTCTDLNGPGYCPEVGQPDRNPNRRGRVPIPHPVDQYAVQLIHLLYTEGQSFRDIADYLNRTRFQLPTGEVVRFRTKGIRNSHPGRPFNRDSTRGIVSNPFYAGLVARYPSKPLDMDDEHLTDVTGRQANKSGAMLNPYGSKRTITEMHPGQHQAIIPLKVWQENQQRKQQRGTMPITADKKIREYLLTGIGFCWECFEWDRRQAGLRGVMGSRNPYYRCATIQDEYKVRRKRRDENQLESLSTIGLQMHEDETIDSLIERHHSSLPKETLENQITALISQLKIPEGWYETILAYYLDDIGMVRFELEGYNLRKELSRQRELFKLGHITQVEYEQAINRIERELHKLQPSTKSEARKIRPLLKEFPAIWSQMNLTERRAILKTIFVGLYFDSGSSLRKALLQSPFDEILTN